MNVEEEVRANTRDIQTLANTVTKLAAVVEGAEKRRDDDMSVIKDAVKNIQDLNQKMTATIGMQKDIETIIEKVSEGRENIRVLRHDVNGIKASQELVAIMTEKLTEAKGRLDAHDKAINSSSAIIEKLTTLLGGQASDLMETKGKLDAQEKAFNAITMNIEKLSTHTNTNASDIAAMKAEINTIKGWKENIEGGAKVARWIWGIVGGGVLVVCGYVLKLYYAGTDGQ